MIRKIRKSDLVPGMYLVKYPQLSMTDPFVFIERPVLSLEGLDKIVPEHVGHVYIDDSISLEVSGRKKEEPEPEAVDKGTALSQEAPVAERLYSEALNYAKDVMDRVRENRGIDYHDSLPLVDRLIDSVFRNEAAVASLCKLKSLDDYSYTHSVNVAVLAVILGRYLGMEGEDLRLLGVAGLFHDIGKARIPLRILNKPGKLTDKEFETMKSHAQKGYDIMKKQKGLSRDVLRAILEHHERVRGQGYPNRIKGEGMGAYTRIISVVDVYDALTSKRSYRRAVSPAKALAMMFQWRTSDFYPESVERFIKCLGVYPVGSFVRLKSGEYGIICESDRNNPARPKVKLLFDKDMRSRRAKIVDLAMFSDTPDEPRAEIDQCLDPGTHNLDLARLLYT